MKVVKITDRAAKTFNGPWTWHDGSVVEGDYLRFEDAVAQGYKPAPPAPPPVPVSVPKWAFILVLRRAGKEAALKAAIAAYSGTNADRVRAKWDADPDIERDGQTVDDLGAAIGLTPPQIDQVFREAKAEADS